MRGDYRFRCTLRGTEGLVKVRGSRHDHDQGALPLGHDGTSVAAQATAAENPDVEAAGVDGESALDGPETQEDPAAGSGTNGMAMILIAVVLAIALGTAGWAWFHRASRYEPA